MRVLFVTGSRDWNDRGAVAQVIAEVRPALVVEGAARGADRIAGELAREAGIPVREFPAEWERYRRAAGPIRNGRMLEFLKDLRGGGHEVDCAAFHPFLSESRGTSDMVGRLRDAGFSYRLVEGSA